MLLYLQIRGTVTINRICDYHYYTILKNLIPNGYNDDLLIVTAIIYILLIVTVMTYSINSTSNNMYSINSTYSIVNDSS